MLLTLSLHRACPAASARPSMCSAHPPCAHRPPPVLPLPRGARTTSVAWTQEGGARWRTRQTLGSGPAGGGQGKTNHAPAALPSPGLSQRPGAAVGRAGTVLAVFSARLRRTDLGWWVRDAGSRLRAKDQRRTSCRACAPVKRGRTGPRWGTHGGRQKPAWGPRACACSPLCASACLCARTLQLWDD